MIDNHLHYTGSLPRSYIFKKLESNYPSFLKDNNIINFDDFNNYINSRFTDDYKNNIKEFNKIYGLFQFVTKPISGDIRDTYKEGCYEIAKQAIKYDILEYNIISGPYINIHNTYERYVGMLNGFDMAEKELNNGYGKIIITFIRGQDGKFKNYSDELLNDIFDMIKQPVFNNRIFGFDISGFEFPNKKLLDENINIIKKIISRKKEIGLDINIGLHAGEIITNTPSDLEYNDYFKKLSELDIQRISHGTYLWSNITPEKTDILRLFSNKCTFDICPKSNKLLTPLGKNKEYLSVFKQENIKFTLNRDDPSIFDNWLIP